MYKLMDWIDPKRIEWHYTFKNPNAIDYIEMYVYKNHSSKDIFRHTTLERPNRLYLDYLGKNTHPAAIGIIEKYLDLVDWNWLSSNPAAISIIEKNLDKVDWPYLCLNPKAIHIIKKYPEKIHWPCLSSNPAAIDILEQNMDKIYWPALAENDAATHLIEKNIDKSIKKYASTYSRYTTAIHLLEQNPECIDWMELARNPHPRAVELVIENWRKIGNLEYLSLNTNPEAIRFLENRPRLINWFWLSCNPKAIHILEKYPYMVEYWQLSNNPAIFELSFNFNRSFLDKRCNIYKEELIQRTMRPSKFVKYIEDGYDIEEVFEFI
jgi:hypothetical protein